MKKSLSFLLAIAMVFGLFASVVSAAESTTELTAQQKFDLLKDKGIFAGMEDGSAGLDQDMNRAQFARIAALLSGLEGIGNPDTKVVTEKPFDDVELGKWYTEEVAAVKEAGIMIGNGDGTFGTDDKIQVQQLAVVAAKLLGLEEVKDATVDGAANYAAGWIQALTNAGVAFPTNYTDNATRGQLVESAFIVDTANAEPAEQGVASLTATGAKKLTVAFDKAVEDATKIKFTVKKGAANVAVAATDAYTWSDDKKSVVITLASKMTAGTYSVAVEPAAADNGVTINNGTNEVTVTNETIKSIDILNASETIAKYDDNRIAFEALNQYDEKSDLGSTAYQIAVGNTNAAVTPYSDKQEVKLDVSNALIVKDTRIALTIVAPNATASATQVFIVGDAPSVAKIEVGDLVLADGKTMLTAGESATLKLTAYDQYGNKVVKNSVLKDTTTLISTRPDVIPGPNKVTETDGLYINADGNLAIKTLAGVSADTDVVLTLIGNGSGQGTNATVKVSAPKSPTDVAFGEFTDTVAKGDSTIYLPIVVTDQFGGTISAKDIATTHVSKFTVFSSNSSVLNNVQIHTTADANQGKIAVDIGNTGTASVTIMINGNNKTVSFPITVQDERVPNSIVVSSEPASKALPNGAVTVKYKVKDQYGKDISTAYDGADYEIQYALDRVSGDTGTMFSGEPADSTTISGEIAVTLTADQAKYGSSKFTASLVKTSATDPDLTLSNVSRTIEAVKASVANDLTYDVAQLGSVFAYAGADADLKAIFAKEVKVTAKDGSGNSVALPATVVSSVYSSDVAKAVVTGSKVNGIAKGEVTLTVVYTPADGNSKVASQTVTVSDVLPYADQLTVANATKANTVTALNGAFVWSSEVAGDIKFVDQYGVEFKNEKLLATSVYDTYTKVKFSVTNVKGGTVTIGADGKLAVSSDVTSFTITVYSLTNGKSASTNVTVY